MPRSHPSRTSSARPIGPASRNRPYSLMSAPALRDLEAGFWRALHESDAGPELLRTVLPSPTLEPAERMDIYRTMYFWRLHEVLSEDYPKTRAALGNEGFEGLVRGYVARHPSRHPSVRHLGRH